MKIGEFFTNLLFNIKLFWHSLFYGMKVADEKTMGVTKDGNAADNAIEEHVSEDSGYADLLKGELTQEVLELRDSNYRGYKGSFDYKYIGNGNVLKKNENMASPKLNVYNPENWNIALIQDNKMVVDGAYEVIISQDANEGSEIDNTNNKYYLKIERDVFPRFLIEKYVKKLVIRENNGEFKIDLKNISLKFRGSSNQRVIDVRETLKKDEGKLKYSWLTPLFKQLDYKVERTQIDTKTVNLTLNNNIRSNSNETYYCTSESGKLKSSNGESAVVVKNGDYYTIAFNGKVYDQEKVYIHTDKECKNCIGFFIAKEGKKDYTLENNDLTLGMVENTSLFNTDIFEDEKTKEVEYVNLTKDEYENMKAKINLLMSLLK